jgi:hypothetical protein
MVTFKQFCETTWNGGFVNFFLGPKQKKGSRHRANIIRDIGSRKNVQTVPEYKRVDPDIIQKVEKLKGNYSHYEPINIIQLKQICKKYNIYKVTKTEPRKLGNTGIAIVWDEKLQTFALKK